MSSGRLTSAFQSVSSQITSVITTGRLGKSNDAKLFASSKRGEVSELKAQLNSPQRDKKKAAVKKVIAAMTLGKDVSSLFTEVVNCMQTNNLELKKLVYLYVINFARTRPELAVLAVNTFRKDTMDPNPLIRALAIRTMGCIRLLQIVEYVVEPLNRLCRDADPYVRKSAAICVGKLYDTSPSAAEEHGFVDLLKSKSNLISSVRPFVQAMMSDSNPMVVVNVVAALSEISLASETDHLEFTPEAISKLLLALPECSEWGQIILLDSIAEFYTPRNSKEAATLIERLTSRLNHANPGVVLSCTRLLIKFLDVANNLSLTQATLSRKILPPLLSLLSSESYELQFVMLRNLQLIGQKYPTLLESECRIFFSKFNDPCYVKFEKLELLIRCAGKSNVDLILEELSEYAQEVDIDFVRRAIRAIGRVALTVDGSVEKALRCLTTLVETKTNFIVEEIIVVVRDIFRKFPNNFESVLNSIIPLAQFIEDPDAKSALVWLLGEYADRIPNADRLLSHYVTTFSDESLPVQLQILTAVMKMYLKFPSTGQEMVCKVLKTATEEQENPDLRDRAVIYWRMLTADANVAKAVVCAARPPIRVEIFSLDEKLLNMLVAKMGLLASVYHQPLETFLAQLKHKHVVPAEIEDDITTDEGERISQPPPVVVAERRRSQILSIHSESAGEEQSSASSSSEGAVSDEDEDSESEVVAPTALRSPAKTNRPVPPRLVFVNASASNGLQIEGCVSRMSNSAVLLLRLMNRSVSPISQLQIKLDPNSFGFNAESAPFGSAIIQAETHTDFAVKLIQGANTNNSPPTSPPSLEATLSCVPLGQIRFRVIFDIINVLMEREAVSKSVFKEHWIRMGETKQMRFLGNNSSGSSYTLAATTAKLETYNIMTVTEVDAEKHSSMYLSAVTTNNLLFLFEISLQKTGAGICVTMRSDAPVLVSSAKPMSVRFVIVHARRPITEHHSANRWDENANVAKHIAIVVDPMGGEMSTFNVQDGFTEAFVRGSRMALLSPEDYRKLGMSESLEDLRSALEDTDYGSFLQDEPAPLAVTTIGLKCRQKMADEFRYLQAQANYPLNKFFDFIVAERMIDNVVSLIQGTLNKKSPEELLGRADPLGWSPEMRALLSLDAAGGYDELYRTVLIDTPVGRYFEEYLNQEDSERHQHQTRTVEEMGDAFSELDLEVMRASLKKSWLEDFYAFCLELGGTTAEVMGDILKRQADFLVLSVTLNSLNAPMGGTSHLSDRNSLYPSFGYLYPSGTDAMRKAYNDATIRSALEPYQPYLDCYEQCRGFYAKDGDDVAGGGNHEEQMSLEDAVYRQEVKLYELAYEQQMHYAVFYAWIKLKEQEIRSILWISDMILMHRKDQMGQVLQIFASRI